MSFLNVGADGTHTVNQLPGDHPAAWIFHHPVGIFPD
jgi:hypothetical protein